MISPKVKTVASTSSVTFRNTSDSYYDMIISIQNQTITQSISITDTEGNSVTENPIVLSVPAKIILKDVKIGTISFSDENVYNVIISYIIKDTIAGIPYVDIDYQNGYTYVQETGSPVVVTKSFDPETGYTVSPPSGKKWILRSLTMSWVAAATGTDYPQVQIFPSSLASDLQDAALNLYFGGLSVTESDTYVVDLSRYVQSRSSTAIVGPYVTEQTVSGAFELYSSETLSIHIGSETGTTTVYLSYIEVNLG